MFIMMFLAVFVALPLGMMRNIESLTNISAISLGFYSVFIAEVRKKHIGKILLETNSQKCTTDSQNFG